MAAKAPLVACFLLLLVVLSSGAADPEPLCDETPKLEKCQAALERKEEGVTDGCCTQLKAQYDCLCKYSRMANPEFLHLITEEVGGLVLLSCELEPLDCNKSAAAAAAA